MKPALASTPRGAAAAAKKPRAARSEPLLDSSTLRRDALRLAGGMAALALLLLILSRFVSLETVHAYAERLNGVLVFALLTVLPLVGFPVNVLHVAVGLRFGFVLGMLLVALSILLQLLASFALVRAWPNLFSRHLAGVRQKIPRAAHGTLCMFTLLLPGVPYFLQNYTLALIGVPFRTYLARGFPLHVLRSVVTVGLGQQSGHFTPAGLTALAVYWALVLTASWYFYRRLRRQIADRPAAGDDPRPRV